MERLVHFSRYVEIMVLYTERRVYRAHQTIESKPLIHHLELHKRGDLWRTDGDAPPVNFLHFLNPLIFEITATSPDQSV